MIKYGEWLPDASDLMNGGSIEVKNVIPSSRGYKPFRSLQPISGAVDEYLRGFHTAKSASGTAFTFVADRQKIYRQSVSGGTPTSVSRASNYSLSSSERWQFATFGSYVIAAGPANSQLQKYQLGADTQFSDISGAPNAKYVAVVKDFVVCANVYYGGNDYPDQVRWSEINSATGWTIGDNQADYQAISDLGHITGIVGGEVGIVFLEKGIARMQYVGSPLIFTFEKLETNQGTRFPGSIASIGPNMTFYLSDNGFFLFDGQRSVPIGDGKVDQFFLQDLNYDKSDRITSIIDPREQVVLWSYPSKESVNDPDKIIIYHWPSGRWSLAEVDHESLGITSSVGLTLEELDNLSSNLDELQISLDDPSLAGGQFQLVCSKDKKINEFSGVPLDATLTTEEFEPSRGRFSVVKSVMPYITTKAAQTSLTVTTAIGSRNRQIDLPTFSDAVAVNENNLCLHRKNGRYHRIKTEISGNWRFALGAEIEFAIQGKR